MDFIEASGLSFSQLNETIRHAGKECRICACQGQRFIAAGMSSQRLEIDGIPGNALGAYLGGGSITVNGNAQDAVGDTMSAGRIVIHGSTGDAAGYAMRGGEIFIRDNAGYRAGIHMKAYKQHKPVIVIGGRAGSFLGEYQAGGLILVLGLHTDGRPIVHFFPYTGMRRKIWRRSHPMCGSTAVCLTVTRRRCSATTIPLSHRTAKTPISRCM